MSGEGRAEAICEADGHIESFKTIGQACLSRRVPRLLACVCRIEKRLCSVQQNIGVTRHEEK